MVSLVTNDTYLRNVALQNVYDMATEYHGLPDEENRQALIRVRKIALRRGDVTPEEIEAQERTARERVEYVDRMAARGIYL